MAGTQVQQSLIVQRARPQNFSDGTQPAGAPRASSYNEQVVLSMIPTKHLLADEGSYYVITNPTIGTGVAHALTTAFSSTAALFSLFNSAPIGGPNIYIDYIRLILTGTAPATATFNDFVVQLDQSLSRAPTANNAALTAVNANLSSGNKGFAQWQAFSAGSLTVPASNTTTKTVARAHLNTGVNVTGDEYVMICGGVDQVGGSGGNTAVRATDTARKVGHLPPLLCAPQTWLTIFRWGVGEATNAPNYEYEIGYWER